MKPYKMGIDPHEPEAYNRNFTDRIPFPHLMRDLSIYHPPYIKDKAMRVYEKCIANGKLEIAKRIRAKYPVWHNKKHDIAEAVGFSLFASQNLGK